MVKKMLRQTLLIFLTVVTLSSCDIFWNMPWAKSANDPTSQLGGVRAVPAGDGKMAVAWDWRPYLISDLLFSTVDLDPDREIVELRILHSVGSPPAFMPPLPFGEAYTDRQDPSGWFKVYDDLKEDREHYFSVYGKEKTGQWVGPVIASRHLEWSDFRNTPPLALIWSDSWDVQYDDTVPGGLPSGSAVSLANGRVSAYNVNIPNFAEGVVIKFDNMGNSGFIETANLSIPLISLTNPGNVTVSVLRFPWQYDTGVPNIEDLINNLVLDDIGSLEVDVPLGSTFLPLSSSEQLLLARRMAMFETWMLFIQPADSAVYLEIDDVSISFSFTYWSN